MITLYLHDYIVTLNAHDHHHTPFLTIQAMSQSILLNNQNE